jgi:hypothetical protein
VAALHLPFADLPPDIRLIFHKLLAKLPVFPNSVSFFALPPWKNGRLCPTMTSPERLSYPQLPFFEGILQPVFGERAKF